MMRRIPLTTLTIIAFSCVGFSKATAAETVESVEKKLAEKWSQVKSMSTTVKMEGASPAMSGAGAYELMKKGDRILFRMELTLGSQATDHMGQKMAVKMKHDEAQAMTPTTQLAKLRETHELKLLPDQSIDGHAVYVIEATPKQQTSGMGRTVSYYAKETGIPLRVTTDDPSGKVMSDMTFTDVKINPKIDVSRFVFKAPEGVQVMDMTNR